MREDIDARCLQQVGQCHQWQADQGVGVPPFKPVEEDNAQPLHLEAASTLVGLLSLQVLVDLFPGQGPEMYVKGFADTLGST